MKQNILVFGLILGVILAAGGIYMVNVIYNNPHLETNDLLGYAVMVVIFSLVFFGIRNYRDKELNGVISLGRAFKTGVLIALLGSTIYVVTWLFYYYLFVPDFLDKFTELVMNTATREGATATELTAKAEELEQYRSWYRNPLFVILLTYAEVLPVGLVVAFVSSLVLKRSPKKNIVNEG